ELDNSGAEALVVAVDVSVPDQVRDAVAAGVERFGGLDIIVNSAAVHPYGTAVSTDFDIWNRAMSVNVGSIYLTAHFGIPEMIRRGGGAIVNVASVQGFACQQNVAAYAFLCSSKAGFCTGADYRIDGGLTAGIGVK
ncbi:MAG: SDR family oxidoreductase, partial [Mesorhizobium sp.]|uniref:SDR family NAD(P)-dependent oxidoreductase n=1 Tax=Mesorhizobium sp. TaxID=1871066 RepID=UPI0012179FE8